jgi:hypothetical protein
VPAKSAAIRIGNNSSGWLRRGSPAVSVEGQYPASPWLVLLSLHYGVCTNRLLQIVDKCRD